MTSSFPVLDLVPKKETNALEYCQNFPNYNGKGVTIGILDTGIDPGASGIRYMEDGVTPKLMDLVDCTGSGDVDMGEIQELVPKSDDGNGGGSYYQVQGLSGRTLKLSLELPLQALPNTTASAPGTASVGKEADTPTLSVRLGLKRVYELFPDSVTNRCKAHRKQLLEQELNGYIADIRSQLAALPNSKLTPTQVQERDDLQAKLETLTDKEWDEDPGVLLDCVVFWNGEQYGALIDSSETGDLRQTAPLYAYRYQQQYATISVVDQYNYTVQFYEQGTILSIVGDITPHGTHVAGIAAGALGDRSGVAPGARLISLKIGDSRMSGMESGSAIIRGIMEAVRLGCDVINLSYGEGCQLPNAGRIIQCAEEMVWRHNIVFVSAVGNNGPALSTVNAPGGLSSCIMGVAAYVSPDMMKADYSLQSNNVTEDDLVGTTYTWSSVGPAADGAIGVSVCAPGGAIASVSNWTMQKSQLMNGTSMSSPHACGCVALLLSACKAEGIPISPPRIQRAIENTCKVMPNLTCLQQGWGMIQVDKALEYLQTHKDIVTEDVRFEVHIDGRAGNPRGIYMRQAEEVSVRQSFGIRVNPKFQRQGAATLQDETQKTKIDFEIQVALESTADWVSTPDHFMLMNNGRAFKIYVDPTRLQPGLHTAKILGRDAEHPERGVMFSVPITVIKPLKEERMIELGELEVR
jgi:tripeptidyl-peptidase-2